MYHHGQRKGSKTTAKTTSPSCHPAAHSMPWRGSLVLAECRRQEPIDSQLCPGFFSRLQKGVSSSLHSKGHKVASRQGTNRFLFVQACCFHCTPIRSASKGVLSMTIIMFRSALLVGGVRKTSVVLRFVSVVHELVSFTFTQQILGGPAASGIQYCWFVHHVAQRTRHRMHQSRKEERDRERGKPSRWEGNPNLRRRQPLSWNKCDCPCFL